MTLQIAIDGYAASGKGTLARNLSKHYGFPCLHTGLLYRALAAEVIKQGGTGEDIALARAVSQGLDFAQLDEAKLRQGSISEVASELAKAQEVRDLLVRRQREFAAKAGEGEGEGEGVILEGRDIGTIILPEAQVKFFTTAELEARAERRYQQLKDERASASKADIIQELQARDERDTKRSVAPLKKAPDAHLLDSTNRSIVETTNQAIQIIDAALR